MADLLNPEPDAKEKLFPFAIFMEMETLQAIQISCQLCSKVDAKDSWAPSNFAKGP